MFPPTVFDFAACAHEPLIFCAFEHTHFHTLTNPELKEGLFLKSHHQGLAPERRILLQNYNGQHELSLR